VYDICMEPNQKQLKLIFKKPIVAHDLVTINSKTSGEVDLIFSQVVKEDDKTIDAQVVAALRFSNVSSLKTTQSLIAEAIEQIEKQEK